MELHNLEVEEGLQIHDSQNECTICGKPFKHLRKNILLLGFDLPETTITTSHARCRKLVANIKRLERELLDAQFDLFLVKFKGKSDN